MFVQRPGATFWAPLDLFQALFLFTDYRSPITFFFLYLLPITGSFPTIANLASNRFFFLNLKAVSFSPCTTA
jgi:hypothetical protein